MINKPDDTAELLAFAVLDDNKRLIAERDRLRDSNRDLRAQLADAALVLVRWMGTTSQARHDKLRPATAAAIGEINALLAKAEQS